MSEPLVRRAASALRRHGSALAMTALGFVLGALVFGVRACAAGDEAPSHADHGGAEAETQIWTCAMHPQIRKGEPGACPICGMDLIPVTDGLAPRDAQGVVWSERAKALARVRTQVVGRQSQASSQLRLLGRIEPDETARKTVTAWTGGRIDNLRVNVTGQQVRAGQVIATLYSPEAFAAHTDLRVAKRQVERLSNSPDASRRAALDALEAARQRLRLLGVPDDELARLETQDRPTEAIPIRTPFAGTVIERMVSEGAYVQTGAPLFRVARLNKLWVQLDAYEDDLPRLARGQAVQVRVQALPAQVFDGEVTFIDPTLDENRRTAKVRVEVDNPDGELLPGMFAEAVVTTRQPEGELGPLVVPATAPLFTGRRAIVYVELAGAARPTYEPRTVRLGPRTGDVYPVVAGLSGGERVVTRGAFMIDADLQIRGGASMMASPDDRAASEWDGALPLSGGERQQLAPLIRHYLEAQRALADDRLTPARTAAEQLSSSLRAVKFERSREAAAAWPALAAALRGHARHLAMASDLEGARAGFEPLSGAVAQVLQRLGNPLDRPLSLAFCPMAMGSEGATWIQEGGDIDNAYFGESMRSCGEVKQQVAPGSYLRSAVQVAEPRPGMPATGHAH